MTSPLFTVVCSRIATKTLMGGAFLAAICLAALLSVVAAPAQAYADETHTHDGITFVAWTDELAAAQNGEGRTAANSQPTVPGNYYLTQNSYVTRGYANQWDVPAGTTHLCLNGYTISKDASGYPGRVIHVNEGAALHLYDDVGTGKITGGGGSYSNSPWNGAGVCVDGGSFYLHGGTITGNRSWTNGPGVLVNSGTFTMTGGEISGNVLAYNNSNAATVYIESGATFTMTGGSIINNTQALEQSCGVRVSSRATFNVAGNPVISGNGNLTNGGTERGLYLGTGCRVNIIGKLSEDFCLPIFSQDQPTADNPIVLTSRLSGNGGIRNFANDRSSYGLRLNADGEVELAAVQLYDLWVGGQRLHESNAADLYGDGTISYDPATNTLTLNNATITARGGGSDDSSYAGINYTGSEQLNIVLSGDSVVTGADSAREYSNAYGIRVYSGTSSVHTNLDISGAGSLRAVGGASAYQGSSNENSYGIFAHGDITVGEGCTVTGVGGSASGESYGIYANGNTWQYQTQTYKEGNLIVSGTLEGISGTSAYENSYGVCANGISVLGGTVKGTAGTTPDYSIGVSTSWFEVDSGTLEGIGSSTTKESYGVYATTSGKVHGGSVVATGGSSTGDDVYGLYVRDTLVIDGGTVTATGGEYAGTSSSYGSYGVYVDNKAVTLSGGTVTATGGPSAAKSYGFYSSRGTTLTDGTLKAVGGTATSSSYGINSITANGGTAELIAGDAPTSGAAESAPNLGSNVWVVVASPNPDGSNPVEYNSSDYRSYRYLKTGLAYNLWVGGRRVHEGNASDIFGDGTASYAGDNSAGTLTLNGASITEVDSYYEANIYKSGIDLTIKLEGKNTLSGGYYGIYGGYSGLALTGTGSLTISLHDSYGIYCSTRLSSDAASVTVEQSNSNPAVYAYNAAFDVNGGVFTVKNTSGNGIYASSSSTVTVNGGTLDVEATGKGIECGNLVVNSGAERLSATTTNSYSGAPIALSTSGNLTLGDGIIYIEPLNAEVREGSIGYSAYRCVYDTSTDARAATVVIEPVRNIAKATVTVSAQTYTGKALTPAPTVKYDGTTLVKGKDYTVTGYKNNTNAGTATVTIAGMGIYGYSKAVTFKIAPASIAKATVTAADQAYTGAALTPAVTVKLGGKTLKAGTDYTVAYKDNTAAGTATVTVTGKGNYTGTATGTFAIAPASLAKATVTAAAQTYTGAALTPAPTVKLGAKTLKAGTDYTVSYKNNTNVGTATVTVTGKGNYTGTATGTFQISAAPEPEPEPEPQPQAADTTALEAAIASVPADLSPYTDESAKAVTEAKAAAEALLGATADQQAKVDAAAKALNDAVKALEQKPAPEPEPGPTPAPELAWTRLAGDDRFGTMQAITLEGYDSAYTVLVATGIDFADALAAAGLSGVLDAPIVTTMPGELSAEAREAITKLGAKEAIILGGEAAVSADVEKQLKAMGLTTSRLAGDNRVDTAVRIWKRGGDAWGGTCILSKGWVAADALAAGSFAYADSAPLFLALPDGTLTPDTAAALKTFDHVVVLGGTGGDAAIKDKTAKSLGVSWMRVAGDTRYETATALATWASGNDSKAAFQPETTLSWDDCAVAFAWNYPDALVGVNATGPKAAVTLLASTDVDEFTQGVADAVSEHADEVTHGYVLGGTSVVSDAVMKLFETAAK